MSLALRTFSLFCVSITFSSYCDFSLFEVSNESGSTVCSILGLTNKPTKETPDLYATIVAVTATVGGAYVGNTLVPELGVVGGGAVGFGAGCLANKLLDSDDTLAFVKKVGAAILLGEAGFYVGKKAGKHFFPGNNDVEHGFGIAGQFTCMWIDQLCGNYEKNDYIARAINIIVASKRMQSKSHDYYFYRRDQNNR